MKPGLCLLLAASVALLSGAPAVSQEVAQPPLVAWKELVDHPALYLGKTVRVRGQFQARVESWSPYLTRFGARDFAAFQLWSDEQYPWIQEEYAMPRMRLFARRGRPAEWGLAGAQMHTRFEFQAQVRELFLDVPWVEIETVTALSEQISEGTNIHAARALELARKESYALAVQEFEQALAGTIPDHARAELVRLHAACKLRLEEAASTHR